MKTKFKINSIVMGCLLLICSCYWACSSEPKKKQVISTVAKIPDPINYDLDSIVNSGVLRVITTYSPTGYFLYKGETMGFEYEMFKRLADHLDISLEIVLAKNVDSVISMLNRGEGDIIALGYTITSDRKEDVSFTDPYMITHQSLIQKKPDNWRKMTRDNIKDAMATDIIDLINDTVSVRQTSSYYLRLKELTTE